MTPELEAMRAELADLLYPSSGLRMKYDIEGKALIEGVCAKYGCCVTWHDATASATIHVPLQHVVITGTVKE